MLANRSHVLRITRVGIQPLSDSAYRIAGIFEGIHFQRNAFRKVFADLIFVD